MTIDSEWLKTFEQSQPAPEILREFLEWIDNTQRSVQSRDLVRKRWRAIMEAGPGSEGSE